MPYSTPRPIALKLEIRLRHHLCLVMAVALAWSSITGGSVMAAENPLPSPRQKLNFNADWRFLRADAPGAEKPEFDAASWTTVSCPHTWNDVDTFDNFATGGHQGESDLWKGTAWYRKEFTLPASARGRKVFIEFEGVRQIADVYLNGRHLGQDKTGFIPFGFDLTPYVKFGEPNVLAVKADNTVLEQFTGDTPWNHQNWHPPHGGIYRDVYLHLTDPLHVTLPLYAHLQTEGIYAWVKSLTKEQASVGVTAEIQNEQTEAIDAVIQFSLVDREGNTVAQVLGKSRACPPAANSRWPRNSRSPIRISGSRPIRMSIRSAWRSSPAASPATSRKPRSASATSVSTPPPVSGSTAIRSSSTAGATSRPRNGPDSARRCPTG